MQSIGAFVCKAIALSWKRILNLFSTHVFKQVYAKSSSKQNRQSFEKHSQDVDNEVCEIVVQRKCDLHTENTVLFLSYGLKTTICKSNAKFFKDSDVLRFNLARRELKIQKKKLIQMWIIGFTNQLSNTSNCMK